jgi:protein-S-isoprenylcysteine O-methyltransferase Ste14
VEVHIAGNIKKFLKYCVEWIGVNQLFIIGSYTLIIATVITIALDTGFCTSNLGLFLQVAVIAIFVISGMLLFFSLWGLATYFIYIPATTDDNAIFATVHGTHLIHPVTSALILLLAGFCLCSGSLIATAIWAALLFSFLIHTLYIIRKLGEEDRFEGAINQHLWIHLVNLVLGGELMTVASGAKSIAPWNLSKLPENTWIVDVRTKSEYNWNRLANSHNFPWGTGVEEAAKDKPKDVPVLVTCLSGHRSPAIAVLLKKMQFTSVYNLNWGLLYLMLFSAGKEQEGPFALTKSQQDPNKRGKDFKGISVGYIVCAALVFVIAPIEHAFYKYHVPWQLITIGMLLIFVGALLGFLSFRALGRNFRVFAAPRRSGSLVNTGVYSRIRHPMYIAVILLVGGYNLVFASLFAFPFWLGCTVFYIIKAVKEEDLLLAKYPEYADYTNTTWRFIPHVW